MPALVSSNVGSPWGIRDELGITLCPLFSKKFKNAFLSSSLFNYYYPSSISNDFTLLF